MTTKNKDNSLEDLQGEDCYAICTEIRQTKNDTEKLVRLGTDVRWLRVNQTHLGLTASGLVATEVCFDTIEEGMARVCPYQPHPFQQGNPNATVRYVPLDSILRTSDVTPIK